MSTEPRVAIVGGGVAGLAAAAQLCERPMSVELFESRRHLGGRAGSFWDAPSSRWIDHCQHVAMGCCTHYADFTRRTGITDLFRHDRTLHFFGPDGRRVDLRAAPGLPPPLHLAPFLARMDYLSWRERYGVATTLLRLARLTPDSATPAPSMRSWLSQQRQTERAIERFWTPVLVSALSETLDRISVGAARQVFVDGFLAHRHAYEVVIPIVSLSEIYDQRVAEYLTSRRVVVHRGVAVEQVGLAGDERPQLTLADDALRTFDRVVLAVPWRQADGLLDESLRHRLPELARAASGMSPAPITAAHLWFDRPITHLPHAVLIGRQSQWLFQRSGVEHPHDGQRTYYYQVVMSASRNLADVEQIQVLSEVLADLRAVWPSSASAQLVRWRLITAREAVFSAASDVEPLRPGQSTSLPWLFLAGDWTRTSWPATMEGAVRSGYLAAYGVLTSLDLPVPERVPELPRGRLFRWMTRTDR